jgi:hypothetical protein
MHTADWYRRKAEECATLAKTARSNEERARNYALAEHYMRRAMDELAVSDSPGKAFHQHETRAGQ